MFSLPDDPATVHRMRAAHSRAAAALSQHLDGRQEAWGWRGRTLGRPVGRSDGRAWLRLVSLPADKAGGKLWEGPEAAHDALPDAVPRPRVLGVEDWADGSWAYRAELYERVSQLPITTEGPILRTEAELPSAWWKGLRRSLDVVAEVPTERVAVRQQYLDRAMPEYLSFTGSRIDTEPPAWSTAHGDLHWANLTGPDLVLLDWEGWGTAPLGFDAAMLHAYSLLTPATAQRVRTELTHVLDTPAGRLAELAVITMLLQTTTRGDNLELEQPLRDRARSLLSGSNRR